MPSGRMSERIMAGEAAAVCAHYDLGVVKEVHRLRRGSGLSPKLLLKTSTGLYLLKRRAGRGRGIEVWAAQTSMAPGSDPRRVALSHEAQIHLLQAAFPVPRLIGTRSDNNSMVQVGERIYEVFEFIPGEPYDRSIGATHDAGRTLGWYHRVMASFTPSWNVAAITYHGLAGIGARIERASTERGGGRVGRAAATELGLLYDTACARVEGLRIAAWPTQVIHGDWHAGNLVFRGGKVAAVVDHDSIGRGPRVLDVANGALQFSMVRPGDGGRVASKSGRPGLRWHERNPEGWPVQADEERIAAFCSGYHAQAGARLSPAQAAAVPWLMIEALVTEAAVALRGMGRSHLLDPAGLLRMVVGKGSWLAACAERLSRAI